MSEQTTPVTTYQPDPTGYDERAPRTPRIGYLVMGLIFLGIAGIWALNASDTVSWSDSKYAFPAVLVGAGVLGLVATMAMNATRRTERDRATETTETTDDTTDEVADDIRDDLPDEETER
jgi:hypothetical protein